MLINLGRLLMLFVWAFLILNLVQPFPRPLNIFVNVALVFMALMHGMQLAGNDSNLLIVFYVQIMPDDFVMQLHRF